MQHDDLQRRFGGLERLYGPLGARRIRAAHVAVVGVGGVGSWAAEALARSGVGCLTLMDMDHVAVSNINRQIHALTPTLGQAKVQAMRERIAHIHPGCTVRCVDDFVTPDNWPALLHGGGEGGGAGNDGPSPHALAAVPAVDAVIDACDDARAKLALCHWARHQHAAAAALFVTVGAAGGKRLAHLVEVDDLARVSHDPLLARLRNRLRREYAAPASPRRMGVMAVFSREAVMQPPAGDACPTAPAGDGSLNCHGYGSVVSVTATFGLCAAGWVLDALAKKPRPDEKIS